MQPFVMSQRAQVLAPPPLSVFFSFTPFTVVDDSKQRAKHTAFGREMNNRATFLYFCRKLNVNIVEWLRSASKDQQRNILLPPSNTNKSRVPQKEVRRRILSGLCNEDLGDLHLCNLHFCDDDLCAHGLCDREFRVHVL